VNIRQASTMIAMAVALRGLAPAQDQPQKIKLATLVPDGSAAHTALKEMGQKWRQLSNGSVTLTIFAGGQQGSEAEAVSRMQTSQLQAALLSAAGLEIIDPSASALQSMPMVFRSLDELDYVREKLRPLLDRRLEAKGFVPLFWGDAGWVRIFSTKPVLHPDDLRKLKLFVLAGNIKEFDMMKGAGFQPVAYEYTNTFTGLTTHQIEAVATIPIYAEAGQFDKSAKYMLNINYVPLVGGLVVNAKAWNSIPPATREEMRKAAEEAGKKITLESRKEMDGAVAAMQRPPRGLQVAPMTPALEKEWRQLLENLPIRGTLVPADMFDEVQRLLREYRK
jgi:TRAP-type C4-dicarboxylate transport system substrate-binding protein